MPEASESADRIAAALARIRHARRTGAGESGLPHGWHGDPHGGHGAHAHAAQGAEGHLHGHGGARGAFGRSLARIRLLELLAAAAHPLSVGEIAERLGVDQPRATRLVHSVVETGHVRRETDPDDARRTLIVLTEEGRTVADRSRCARVETVEQALAGFTPAEQEQLAELLSRLADAWPRPER